MRRAVRIIDAERGALRIEELARRLGVSRQHLAQQFRERVGLNAKTFAMVERFGHAAGMVRAQDGARVDWTRVAADCGYYDQSHLIHEFRLFTGEAPDAFVRG